MKERKDNKNSKIRKKPQPEDSAANECEKDSAAEYSPEMRLHCCSRHTARIKGCLQWDAAAVCMGVLVGCFALLSIGFFSFVVYDALQEQQSLRDLRASPSVS